MGEGRRGRGLGGGGGGAKGGEGTLDDTVSIKAVTLGG